MRVAQVARSEWLENKPVKPAAEHIRATTDASVLTPIGTVENHVRSRRNLMNTPLESAECLI